MSLTFSQTQGNGSTLSYPIVAKGGYFEDTDIVVELITIADGTITEQTKDTDYTIENNNVIFTVAPTSNYYVRIRRSTDNESTYSDFTRGNAFGATNLNNSFLYALYQMQQLADGFLPDDHYWKSDVNAGNRRLYNLAAPLDDNDAVTKEWSVARTQEVVDDINSLLSDIASGSITKASNIIYSHPSSNDIARSVQDKLSESVSVKDFNAKGDGVTDDTYAILNAIASGVPVYFDDSTYRCELTISTNDTTLIFDNTTLKLYSPGNLSDGDHPTLKITGTGVTLHGNVTIDGYGDIEDYTPTENDAVLMVTGDDFTSYGVVTLKHGRANGLFVWNGISRNTGTEVKNFNGNRFIAIDNRLAGVSYAINFWSVDGFRVNSFEYLGSGDRVRTGTQSSSNLACRNGWIGEIKGTSTIETNTKNVHFGLMHGKGGHKIEDSANIIVDRVNIQDIDTGSGYAFAIQTEFPSIGTHDIHIGDIYIKGCTSSTTNQAMNINGVTGCVIDRMHIKNCSYGTDLNIRVAINCYIGECYLDNDGSAAIGLNEEGGYVREDVVIDRMKSEGHSSYDIVQNAGQIRINTLNNNASKLYDVCQSRKDNFIKDKNFTVGPTGNFKNLHEAFQKITEGYNSVYFNRPAYYKNPNFILTLQTGYVWNESILIDGINLGFINIVTETSTDVGSQRAIHGKNGAVLPSISGTYTKGGRGGEFIYVSNNASGVFNGVLTDFINHPFEARSGGKLDLTASSSTKYTAAADAATVTAAYYGGTIVASSATTSRLEVFGGGIIYAYNATVVGGTSVTVNTLTANGIIFK